MVDKTTALRIEADRMLQDVRDLRSDTITAQDAECFQNIVVPEKRAILLKNDPQQIPETLRNYLAVASIVQVKYCLVVVEDFLKADPTHADLLTNGHSSDTFRLLFNLMHDLEPFAKNMAAVTIAELATRTRDPSNGMPLNMAREYFMLVLLRLNKEDDRSKYITSAARCLQIMLRNEIYRMLFVDMGLIPKLIDLIDNHDAFQLQYQLIYCMWLLSFSDKVVEIMAHHNTVVILSDIIELGSTNLEKINRIILAVFRNLLENSDDKQLVRSVCASMINCKVMRQLDLMAEHEIFDPDLEDDIAFLAERLADGLVEMSTFELYAGELHSDRLWWSPVHRSADFWKANVTKLDGNDYEHLRRLLQILRESQKLLSLCVACYDVGEYARFHPKGKINVERFGGKTSLIYLLAHSSAKVRYEALLALQKLMTLDWKYIEKPISDKPADDNR